MPVPLSQSSSAVEKEVDGSGIQLLWGVGLLLLVFALVFLIVYPNREKPAFSELYWASPPVLSPDANGMVLAFGVRVNSREQSSLNYHLDAKIEGALAAEKDFSLDPGQGETFDFNLSLKGNFQAQNELRVTLARASVGDENKSFPPLEILDWFSAPDSNSISVNPVSR